MAKLFSALFGGGGEKKPKKVPEPTDTKATEEQAALLRRRQRGGSLSRSTDLAPFRGSSQMSEMFSSGKPTLGAG